jgi:nucleosome binding factor SPN SPT16 subunit
MITIFNRKELLITLKMDRLTKVREILSSNRIPYIVKTTNLQSTSFIGSSRSRTSSFGIELSQTYEYRVFVYKDDYNKALHLIR